MSKRQIILDNIMGDSVITIRNSENDSLKIFRRIEIIENHNVDTILLGYSIVPPKYTGAIYFTQNSLDKSEAVYIDKENGLNENDSASYSKLFTIGIWRKSNYSKFNKMVIDLYLKE